MARGHSASEGKGKRRFVILLLNIIFKFVRYFSRILTAASVNMALLL